MAARVSLLLIWGVLFQSYGMSLGIPSWRRGSVVYDGDFLRIKDPRTTPINTRISDGRPTNHEKLRNSGTRRSSFRNTARITSNSGYEKFTEKPDEPSALSPNSSSGIRIVTAQPEGSTRNSSQSRTSRLLVQPQGLAATSRRISEDEGGNYKSGFILLSHNSTKSRTRGYQRLRIEPTLQSRKLRYGRNSTHINTEIDTIRKHITQSKNNYTISEALANPYKAKNSTFHNYRSLSSSVKHLDRINEPSRNNVSNAIDFKAQHNLHQIRNKTQQEFLIKEADDEASITNISKYILSPDLNINKSVVHNVHAALTKSKTPSSLLRYRSFPAMSVSHTRQSLPPGVISVDRPVSARIHLEELRRKLYSRKLNLGSREANKIKKLRGVTLENKHTMLPSNSTERTVFSYTTVIEPKYHTIVTTTPSTSAQSSTTSSTPTPSTTTPSRDESEIPIIINSSNSVENKLTDKSTLKLVILDDELMAIMDNTTEMPLTGLDISNNTNSANNFEPLNMSISSKTFLAVNNYKNNTVSSNAKGNVTNLLSSEPKSISIHLDYLLNRTISSGISTSSFTASTTVHVSFGNNKTTTETFESSHFNKSQTNTSAISLDEPLVNYSAYDEPTTNKIAILPIEISFTNGNMSLNISSIESNSTSQKLSIVVDELGSDIQHNVTKPLQKSVNLSHDGQILTMNNTKRTETISLLDASEILSNSNKYTKADETADINKTGIMVGSLQKENLDYTNNEHNNISQQPNRNGDNISLERNDLQGSDSIQIHFKTAGPNLTNIVQSPASQRLGKDPVKQKIADISPSYLYLLNEPLGIDITDRPSTHTHQNAEFVSENKNVELNDTSISDNSIKSLDSITIMPMSEDNMNESNAVKDQINLQAIHVDNNQTFILKDNMSQNLTKYEIPDTLVEKKPLIEVHQSSSHTMSVSTVRVESHSVVSHSVVSSHRGGHKLPSLSGNISDTISDSLALINTEKPFSSHGSNPFGINPFGKTPAGLSPFGGNPFGQQQSGISRAVTNQTEVLNSKFNNSDVVILNVNKTNQVEKPSNFPNSNDIDIIKNISSKLASTDSFTLQPANLNPNERVDELNRSSRFHNEKKRPDGTLEGEVGYFNHSSKTIFNAFRFEANENVDPELIAYGLALWENL